MFIYIIVFITSGLILPRLILSRFGSDYNGVIATITQFIGYILLLAAGAAGATRAALYKPLVENNIIKISGIIRATEGFFRKVALMFAIMLVVLAILYPFLVIDNFNWFFLFSLTLVLGISTFVSYFFGVTYQTLLMADQRAYVNTIIRTGAVILNVTIAASLILVGVEIRLVMLGSAVALAVHPLIIYFYARKYYRLERSVPADNSAISQRWDAFVHQLADFIQLNAGIIIVTVFLGIMEASVFAVYIFIIRTVRFIVISISGVGVEAPFGDMLAKGEHKGLQDGVRINEFLINSASTLLLTCTALLIVPFVTIYTEGVYDADYFQPLFAFVACVAEFFRIAHVPSQSLVNAAGHYRQTKFGAIAEMVINIVLSVVFVQFLGLTGVALGLLCALMFRTLQLSIYASRHILKRSIWVSLRKILLSIITACVTIVLASLLPQMTQVTYLSWMLSALPVFGVAVGVSGFVAVLFYREELKILFRIILKILPSNPKHKLE